MPSFNIPHFNLPAGFHPPDTAMIKRLLYIGIVVLSFVLSAVGAMKNYSQRHQGFDGYYGYTRFIPQREIDNALQRRKSQLEYERTPWDRPEVQKRMMKYLDNNYGDHKPWLFPYQDTYITYPPDMKYELDPKRRRKIKRKHFDMLTEILKRQAYKDNPGVSLYPNIDRVKLLPDIPGLDDSLEQRYIWDYASDPIKRMNFRYRGFDKPTYDDDDDLD